MELNSQEVDIRFRITLEFIKNTRILRYMLDFANKYSINS